MIRELRKLDLFPYTAGDDEVFCDSRRFFKMLSDGFDNIDCITYTYGYHPLTNLRKVITNLVCMDAANIKVSCKELRVETNTHTKLYLCYAGVQLVYCFTGSLNLRAGINYNLMYRMHPKHNKAMQHYFDTLWKHATKFSTKLNAGNVDATQQKQTTKQNIWQ